MRDDWPQFGGAPERRFHVGDRIQATGRVRFYQGDPVIYATSPQQLRRLGRR